jgi:uncharacterized protein (DUF4213/DUF364 family)
MSIRDRIRDATLPLAGELRVSAVRIGLRYTAVQLENGRVGLAYTFRDDFHGNSPLFRENKPLAGLRAAQCIPLLDSPDRVESAVGLACSNALSNTLKEGTIGGDALDILELRPEDAVGMVGHFAPMVPALRRAVSSLSIFERIDRPRGEILPQKDIGEHLPRCQVAIVTSTAILNHTIDDILGAARSCREVVLLGASTPLIPEAFRGTPVTLLSGVVVTQPEKILDIVGEGGGTRRFRPSVEKINVGIL